VARLDGPAGAAIERLLRIASQHYRVPLALVSLASAGEAWCRASSGEELSESELEHSFAAHAIRHPREVLVLEDATADARFREHPWVRGARGVRFCLSAPVVLPDGRAAGALTVLGRRRRTPPAHGELQPLRDLAALVADAIRGVEERQRYDAARTEQAALLAELARADASDPLTGLLNRRALFDRLEAAIALARRTGHGVAVALCDLERFRLVNERYGHGVGDGLLLQVASALEGAAREHDLAARMGSDEFVLLWQAIGPDGALVAADRVWKAVARSYTVTGAEAPGTALIELGASLGVACFPHDAEDAVGLLRAADVALHAAKRSGGGVVRFDAAV
jgi:diguanylate cyclase